jgi:hypothetical protein
MTLAMRNTTASLLAALVLIPSAAVFDRPFRD